MAISCITFFAIFWVNIYVFNITEFGANIATYMTTIAPKRQNKPAERFICKGFRDFANLYNWGFGLFSNASVDIENQYIETV